LTTHNAAETDPLECLAANPVPGVACRGDPAAEAGVALCELTGDMFQPPLPTSIPPAANRRGCAVENRARGERHGKKRWLTDPALTSCHTTRAR
jgi:hypothetical protein